jgi:hypothetical protein
MLVVRPRGLAALALIVFPLACSGRSEPLSKPDADASSIGEGGGPPAATDAASPASDVAAPLPDAVPPAPDAMSAAGEVSSEVGDATDAGAGPAAYPGFTLVLDEEFDQPLDLDADPVWTWGDGAPEGGATRFVKDALTFAGGRLVITETMPSAPVTAGPSYSQPARDMTTGAMPARVLQSGELRTRHNNFRYGRYEARMTLAMPADLLAEPALASIFVDRQPEWQQWSEIDLELAANRTHAVTYAVAVENGATVYKPQANGVATPAAPYAITETHDYALTWLPDRIEWSVDGVVVKSSAELPGVVVPSLSAKIRLNLWTVQAGLAPPFAADYPATLAVDWVRFYKWDQDGTYPCAPAPACLPPDDVDFALDNVDELARQ